MLFWVLVILLILGFVFLKVYNDTINDVLEIISCIIFAPALMVSGIGLIVSFIAFSISYIGLDGQIESMKQEKAAIVYQLKNNIYENDNDLGLKETINEAIEWNKNISWNKENQKDFWVGIYIPDIYDDFELIDIEGIMEKGDLQNE